MVLDMNKNDELKMLYGAYYGVMEMDSYKTKEFVLKKIRNLISDFIEENKMTDIDNIEKLAKEQSLLTKLQDSLYVLKELDESLELILMIKEKCGELKRAK